MATAGVSTPIFATADAVRGGDEIECEIDSIEVIGQPTKKLKLNSNAEAVSRRGVTITPFRKRTTDDGEHEEDGTTTDPVVMVMGWGISTEARADTDKSPPPKSIYDLPAEIINNIYLMALFGEMPEDQRKVAMHGHLDAKWDKTPKVCTPALFPTSRKVRSDAFRVLLGFSLVRVYVRPADRSDVCAAYFYVTSALFELDQNCIKELCIHIPDAFWKTLYNFYLIPHIIRKTGIKATVGCIMNIQHKGWWPDLPSTTHQGRAASDKGILVLVKGNSKLMEAFQALLDLGMRAHQEDWSGPQLQEALTEKVKVYFSKGPGRQATKLLKKRADGVTIEELEGLQLFTWANQDMHAVISRDPQPAAHHPATTIAARALHMQLRGEDDGRIILSQARPAGFRNLYWLNRVARTNVVQIPYADLLLPEVYAVALLELENGQIIPVKLSETPSRVAYLTVHTTRQELSINEFTLTSGITTAGQTFSSVMTALPPGMQTVPTAAVPQPSPLVFHAALLHLVPRSGEHDSLKILHTARAAGYTDLPVEFFRQAKKTVVTVPPMYAFPPNAFAYGFLQNYDGKILPVTLSMGLVATPHLQIRDVPLYINSLTYSRHLARSRPYHEVPPQAPRNEVMNIFAPALRHDALASHYTRANTGHSFQARSYGYAMTTVNGGRTETVVLAQAYLTERHVSGTFYALATGPVKTVCQLPNAGHHDSGVFILGGNSNT